MRCAFVVRMVFVVAAGFLVGPAQRANAWQLRSVSETELPALAAPPADEPRLLVPEVGAAAELVIRSDEAPPADLPFPFTPPEPPSPPVAAIDEPTKEPIVEATGAGSSLLGPLREPNAIRSQIKPPQQIPGMRAAVFRGVTAGETRREDLIRAWGEPIEQIAGDGGDTLRYGLAPFAHIKVIVTNDIVASIIGHFRKPATLDAVVELFDLQPFTPASIVGDDGNLLGRVYPERGILLGMTSHSETPLVGQIAIEPIAAEGFLLRAEQHWRRQPQRSLADVQLALRIQPDADRAQTLAAKILHATGKTAEALTALEKVFETTPDDPDRALLRAELLAALGRLDDAEAALQHVLENRQTPLSYHAQAKRLAGDLAASGPHRDLRAAMTHHQEAVRLAASAMSEAAGDDWKASVEAAIEADLSITRNLALGRWRNHGPAIAEWVEHAQQLADQLTGDDGTEWRFRISCAALAASAGVKGEIDAAPHANAANEVASRLLAESSDPWRRAQIQWRLGEALLKASHSLYGAGKQELARGYAQDALRLLEAASPHRGASEEREYLLGRLYFLLGADAALTKRDHPAAVKWYDKVVARLERPLPATHRADSGEHGERLVAMAVSYWQVDQQAKAVSLTEKGLGLMQQAIAQGLLDRTALAVPLNNLASMNRALGNDEQAEQYQTRLVDFQTPVEEEDK